MGNDMIVRRMSEEDIDAVSAIETKSFSMPWSRKSILDAMKREENIYLVAEEQGEIVGYAGMWMVMGEGEIVVVAVKETARRQGIGAAIFETLIEEGRKAGTDIFFLEVRASNAAAQKLYVKQGFSEIGRRRNFYERPMEDAIVMSRTFF